MLILANAIGCNFLVPEFVAGGLTFIRVGNKAYLLNDLPFFPELIGQR